VAATRSGPLTIWSPSLGATSAVTGGLASETTVTVTMPDGSLVASLPA
jgi:hypothetical protein